MTARSDKEEQALDQAIAWHQALARDDADWDGYLTWLDADPRHRVLFDEIALLDRAVDEHAPDLRSLSAVSVPVPTPSGGKSPRHRRWWIGGAVAAAIVAAVSVPNPASAPADRVYATAVGETRRLALGRGETVELAPSSRLLVKDGDPRSLELARGEAFFSVAHDPARVLSIKAGDFAVTDIGTKFGVNLAADSVTVAVAEGHVAVATKEGRGQKIGAGQQIVGRARVLSEVKPIASGDVGSWRAGRLVYDQIPLSVVANDLARYSGKMVSVEPAIGERPFSGVLSVGDGSRLFQDLSDLMAISYRTEGDRVRLVAKPVR